VFGTLTLRLLGCSELWFYGTLASSVLGCSDSWVYCTFGSSDSVSHSDLRTLFGCLLQVVWFFGYFLGRMARW
jgi:hypothetical protein